MDNITLKAFFYAIPVSIAATFSIDKLWALIIWKKNSVGFDRCKMKAIFSPNLPSNQMGFSLPFILQAFRPTHSVVNGLETGIRTNDKEFSDVPFRTKKEEYIWR